MVHRPMLPSVLVILLILATLSPICHARPVTLALITEDAALAPAAALLMAELSARDQMALVERVKHLEPSLPKLSGGQQADPQPEPE
jgi:hypothetical protein